MGSKTFSSSRWYSFNMEEMKHIGCAKHPTFLESDAEH